MSNTNCMRHVNSGREVCQKPGGYSETGVDVSTSPWRGRARRFSTPAEIYSVVSLNACDELQAEMGC